MVVVWVDFFRNSIDRVTGRLAEQKDFVSSVYDDDPGNLDASVGEEPGSAIGSHLIRTGDWIIKSEDSVPADVLAPGSVSVPVEKQNAKRRQWPRAGASRPVGPIGSVKGFVRAGPFMLIVCMNWLYL
jgi:hypothetical protein